MLLKIDKQEYKEVNNTIDLNSMGYYCPSAWAMPILFDMAQHNMGMGSLKFYRWKKEITGSLKTLLRDFLVPDSDNTSD